MPEILTAAELAEIESRAAQESVGHGLMRAGIGGHVKRAVPCGCVVCVDFPRAVATIRALAEALEWTLVFVQEPDYFPNPGDAQSWREHLDAMLALARRVLGEGNA